MNPNIENANTEKAELSYIVYWEAQIWWTSSAQNVCIFCDIQQQVSKSPLPQPARRCV